jgi:PAS domain S-box-containing protein
MLWLYLLAAITCLVILLRRLKKRVIPLDDELYSKNVAIEHVNTGVAWISSDGKIGTVNPALARSLEATSTALVGNDWCNIFAPAERDKVREAFSQMLLIGKASFEAHGLRANGTLCWLEVLIVAVHDHKMRFVGHHCITEDRTRERELKERVDQLTRSSGVVN